MPGKISPISTRWFVCGLLFLVTTVNYIDRSALGLVEPVLKRLLGGDLDPSFYNRQYSHIVTCFIVAYGLGFLVMGRVVDRIGARRGLAVSIAIWALASISHAFARTAPEFGLARFALGLGESGNFPAALKATADWFPPQERALATGIFNSGTSAASLIAPILVPWVAFRFGWQAAFFVTGGLSLLWLAGWLLFPYQRLLRAQWNAAIPVTEKQSTPRASFRSLLSTRATWAFACSKALTDPVWWFYLFWLPKYFHERFLVDMNRLGLPLILVYVGATVGSIAGGWLSAAVMRRGFPLRSARRFAMLVCALGSLAVVGVPFAHSIGQAICLLCLATASHQGWSSNLLSTPSDTFPSASVGTVVGIGGAVGSIGSAAFTTLVGILWSRHPLALFLIAGFVYLAALFIFQIGLGSVPLDPNDPVDTPA
ncbi:MAG TPA: MFS transporter [Terracidiphilus sp.]|jgi:ACS family hexuronate transporter-like MFS transporter|nr:MFS transporter [Terracidiphilus sp.]